MNKSFLLLLALCASAGAYAFPGALNLSQSAGPVKRTLVLSKWTVDKRGVPSFDYRYSQSGPGCDYERSGRAIAGFEQDGDEVELQVYSGEDENGNEGPPMTIFYDHDDEVVLSMANADHPKPDWVSFNDTAMKAKFAQTCGFTDEDSAAMFKK